MSLRIPVGLADLARACDYLRPSDGIAVAQIARLLGLSAVGPLQVAFPSKLNETAKLDAHPLVVSSDIAFETSLKEGIVELSPENAEIEDSAQSVSPLRQKLETSQVWGNPRFKLGFPSKRPVRADPGPIPAASPMPDSIADAEMWPLQLDSTKVNRSPEPLLRRGIRRAFLRDTVATWGRFGEVDTVSLVDSIARGRLLRRIPQMKRKSIERAPIFLIDVSDDMVLFLEDANEIVDLAYAMLGCTNSSITWSNGPPDASGRDDTRPWPELAFGDTLVVVSLLGLGASGAEASEWRQFAREAYRRGVHLVALTPALATHWARSFERGLWDFVPWMPSGRHHRLATEDQVEALATWLSVASHPDPKLLRRARLQFFPDVEPYLETMLIRSRWCMAAYRGRLIMSHHDFAYQHEKLSKCPVLLEQARRLTACEDVVLSHNRESEVLAERLWLDALSHEPHASGRVASALAGMVKTLHENPNDSSFARFAHTVLARLPASVRSSELGQLATLLIRSGLQQQLDEETLAVATKHQEWLYPRSIAVGLMWNGRKLYFRDRPRSGDALITVPDMARIHVRIDWGPYLNTEWRRFFRGQRTGVVAPELPVAVTTLRGQSFLLSQPDESAIWHALEQSLSEGQIINGNIMSIVARGERMDGYLIDVGVTAFMPASQLTGTAFVEEPETWIGKIEPVIVTALNQSARHVIVSRAKAIISLAKVSSDTNSSINERHPVGEVVMCRVRHITDFGAIVELEDRVTGLIHRSNISWGNSFHKISDMLSIGQEVQAIVLRNEPTEKKFHLGIKQLLPNPWVTLEDRLPVGTVVKRRVCNLTEFGAYVELESDINGMIHPSEISWTKKTQNPKEILNLGQEIEAVILTIDQVNQRVSLGLKQLQNNPWENIEARYPLGQRVRGKVTKLVAYGAFVEVEEGVEGLVHLSELSWSKRIARPSDVLNVGQEIEASVLGINKEERKISLGMRQLEANPWDDIDTRYPIGTQLKRAVRNLTAYGAFVELEEGIDGMIHVSDLSWTRKINHPSELLKKGQEVDAVVLDVDKVKQRISLGVKQLHADPWLHIDEYLQRDKLVYGRVSKITEMSILVNILGDLDCHIQTSEIADDFLKKKLEVGIKVSAVVVNVDKVERRIDLCLKEISPR